MANKEGLQRTLCMYKAHSAPQKDWNKAGHKCFILNSFNLDKLMLDLWMQYLFRLYIYIYIYIFSLQKLILSFVYIKYTHKLFRDSKHLPFQSIIIKLLWKLIIKLKYYVRRLTDVFSLLHIFLFGVMEGTMKFISHFK